MNCTDTQELLYDYIKNEASVREISDIETHLKNCPACSSELAHVKGICSLLRASMEEPHDSVLLNISRSIRPEKAQRFAWFKPALAAASLLIAVGSGLLFYGRSPSIEMAEVPLEMAAGYAVVDDSMLEEPAQEAAAGTDAESPDDGGYYAGNSGYYTGGYTPVSYIIGQ